MEFCTVADLITTYRFNKSIFFMKINGKMATTRNMLFMIYLTTLYVAQTISTETYKD
jgi:hypothetical protein